ncbi:hypothetical protein GCM10010507_21460 [Streptomyces cinnamoneus]|uniref:Uncharacterized protein n=1 Tax=Streptomyces cinnamoneus TaxID=53446 RepID=A0A918THZ1_STRCJ|nr:hypothetical protein GCM10010507_21460 [Streptomyces cinnamoneus]
MRRIEGGLCSDDDFGYPSPRPQGRRARPATMRTAATELSQPSPLDLMEQGEGVTGQKFFQPPQLW